MIGVLLMAQYPLVRAGVSTILSTTEGVELVDTATAADQLLQLCQCHQPDVVLLSLNSLQPPYAPIFNDIGRHAPAAKFLLLLDSGIEPRELTQWRVTGALLKSDAAERLVEAIRAVAAGEFWFSPNLKRLIPTAKDAPTPREVEVLQLVANDKTDGEIAAVLGISVSTVRFHLGNCHAKLGTHVRAGVAAEALRRKWIY